MHIRLVIDAIEALRADVHYEEFVIASGDSDMTPLIVRLRASDRRTTPLSPSDSAVVLGAVADRLIGVRSFLILETRPEELDDDLEDSAAVDLEGGIEAPSAGRGLTEVEAKMMLGELVAQRYAQASEPMNLAALAHDLRGELGPVTSTSRWFGYNGFARALRALDLPGVRMSQHFIWDSTRHPAPTAAGADSVGPQLPDPVRRVTVTAVLKLPTLPSESWSNIYDSLAGFVAAYDFNLTEATRWSRDRLAERGIRVNRQVVGVVAHGTAYAGCPQYRQPPLQPKTSARPLWRTSSTARPQQISTCHRRKSRRCVAGSGCRETVCSACGCGGMALQ